MNRLTQLVDKQTTPPLVDVAIQTEGFILGENKNVSNATIERVRKRKINNSIGTAKGDRRFGSIPCERIEAGAFASCKNDCQNVLHERISVRLEVGTNNPEADQTISFTRFILWTAQIGL